MTIIIRSQIIKTTGMFCLAFSILPALGQQRSTPAGPPQVSTRILKARSLCASRHYKIALKICAEEALKSPLTSYGISVLAWGKAGQGDLVTAKHLLLKAADMASTPSEKTICYQLMAEVCESENDITGARGAFEKALCANPDHGNAIQWKARIAKLLQESSSDLNKSNYIDETPGNLKGWRPNKVIRVWISPSKDSDDEYSIAVKDALAEWARNAATLKFEFVRNINLADMSIFYVTEDRLKNSTTATRYDDSGHIVEARVYIAKTDPTSDSYEAVKTLTCVHEIGHALGIQGHSDSHDDVMYDSILFALPSHLSDRDKNTLRALQERSIN